MSVKKEANGRRSVQVEVEVPGTPEQVWQAIATGPGVGAWPRGLSANRMPARTSKNISSERALLPTDV